MKTLCQSLLSILLFALGFSACIEADLCPPVTIPETDTTPPIFTFSLKGPGIDQTIATEDGWTEGSAVLLVGGTYNYVFSASDAGGARLLRMQVPGEDIFILEDQAPDRVVIRPVSGGFTNLLELDSDLEAPTSCLIMSGSFTINNDPNPSNTSSGMGITVHDYGGTAGNRNITTIRINLQFSDDVSDASLVQQ